MSELTVDEVREIALGFEAIIADAQFDEVDFGDDEDTIAQARDQLTESLVALESIQAENGVCRDMLFSLESALPAGYPLKSFTQNPTRTNQDVAVASLEAWNWGLIATIIAAIVSIIGTIVGLIFKSRAAATPQDADRATRVAVDNQRKADNKNPDELKQIQDKVNDTVNGVKWNRLQEAVSITPPDYVVNLFLINVFLYIEIPDQLNEGVTWIESIVREGAKDTDFATIDKYSTMVDNSLRQADLGLKSVGGMGENPADQLRSSLRKIEETLSANEKEPPITPFNIADYNQFMANQEAGITWTTRIRHIGPVDAQNDRRFEEAMKALKGRAQKLQQKKISFQPTKMDFGQGVEKDRVDLQKVVNQYLTKTLTAIDCIFTYTKLRFRILGEERKVYNYLTSYHREL